MRTLIVVVLLALLINNALAGISSSSGLQRKVPGDNCTIQWTVTGTVKNFVVYNQTTGTPVAQNNSRVSLKRDVTGNTIILTITNVALWDAGNYTLSVTNGVAWENDSNALLFVFATGSNSLSITSGRNPPTEGDTVELTCPFTSTSKPAAYRPGYVYSWYPSRFSYTAQVLSNGSLQLPSGDIISGYSCKNGAGKLTISSVQYFDAAQYIYCYVKEIGSTLLPASASFYLNVQYKPVVTSTVPPTGKFNALVGERVNLYIYPRSYPGLLSIGNNWTFVNSQGAILDVPDGSIVGASSNPSLSFTLPSVGYYGKYSYNLTNAIGTTMVTLDVLAPGKPDPPAAFQLAYASHFAIGLQFNCMSSNYYSHTMFFYTALREPKSNTIIGNQSYSLPGSCYNQTSYVNFNTKIQPDTSYEASVFSANDLGSSVTTTITVRSAKVFRFIVSPEIIGTTVIINYRVESGNITRFIVTCYNELTTTQVSTGYLNVNSNNMGQVNFSIASLPNGTEYVLDFNLYVGSVNYNSLAGYVKGVRVSTVMGNTTPTDASLPNLVPAVTALAIVLGIALLAIAAMLIAFFVWKKRHYNPTSNQHELKPGTNGSITEDHYEKMNRQTSENRVYANLDLKAERT